MNRCGFSAVLAVITAVVAAGVDRVSATAETCGFLTETVEVTLFAGTVSSSVNENSFEPSLWRHS